MNSAYMKSALLNKLRFVQRCPYLATEVGAWGADVLAIMNNKMVEYETKISLSDFRADFKNKPEKHDLYRKMKTLDKIPEDYNGWVPHQFYFVIPESLVDAVSAYLVNYPEYGLIVVKQVTSTWRLREAPVILKRAQLLHKFDIPQGVYKQFLYRMGSELASLSTLRIRGTHGDKIETEDETT